MSEVGNNFLGMLKDASPRLLLVAGLISALTDISHGGTFICGVIALYGWKALKYEVKEGRR